MLGEKFYSGRDSQIAIEFIIIVGIVLLIVVAVTPSIMKQQELNKALSAARDGAAFGAGMRGLGFEGAGVNEVPEGIVKIEKIELVTGGIESGLQKYTIRFYVSAPEYIKTNPSCTFTTVGATITNQALRYVKYAFTGAWPGSTVSRVNTSYYTFTAGCVWN